jgi:predicted metal-dependent hydrolase
MHLRQMNHSVRFWREVETVCLYYETAALEDAPPHKSIPPV